MIKTDDLQNLKIVKNPQLYENNRGFYIILYRIYGMFHDFSNGNIVLSLMGI